MDSTSSNNSYLSENVYPDKALKMERSEADRILEILQPLNPEHQNGVISNVRDMIRTQRETELCRLQKDAEYLKNTLGGI